MLIRMTVKGSEVFWSETRTPLPSSPSSFLVEGSPASIAVAGCRSFLTVCTHLTPSCLCHLKRAPSGRLAPCSLHSPHPSPLSPSFFSLSTTGPAMAPINPRRTGTTEAVARSGSQKARAKQAKSVRTTGTKDVDENPSGGQLRQAAFKAARRAARWAARLAAHKERVRLAGAALVEWEGTGSAHLNFGPMLDSACGVEAPEGVDAEWWRCVFGAAASALWGINNRAPGETIAQELNKFADALGRGDPLTSDAIDVLGEFDAAHRRAMSAPVCIARFVKRYRCGLPDTKA